MRQGDFSELLDPNNPYVTRRIAPEQDPRLIKDPQSANPCTVADQSGCFPGNVIPSGRLSPDGIGILNMWPVPIPSLLAATGSPPSATRSTNARIHLLSTSICRKASSQASRNQLLLSRIPASGWKHGPYTEVFRSSQPDCFNQLRLDSQPYQSKRIPRYCQRGYRQDPDRREEFLRPDAGLQWLPVPCGLYQYIFTDPKLVPTRIPLSPCPVLILLAEDPTHRTPPGPFTTFLTASLGQGQPHD